MTRGERTWCLAVGAFLAVATTLPFLLGYERQGADMRFTGSVFAVEDGNSYIAKMRRGAEGDWLFRSPYTADEQAGAPAFIGYLLLGKLASGRGSHEQLVALLHLARILAIPLVVFATYRFASRFVPEGRWRKWATILAVGGGGLGWLVFLFGSSAWLGSQPLELYSPETFGFLAALTFPHLLLARAFLLLGLDAYLESAVRPRSAWFAAGWLVLLVVMQPLSIAAAASAIGAHQILLHVRGGFKHHRPGLWPTLRPAVIALAVPVLMLVGYGLLLRQDSFLQTWAAQNILASPHPAHYVLAYGLLLPFVIPGIRHAWRVERGDGLMLIGWVVLLPVLAYAPTVIQRRLPEGGWVALAALAAIGLGGIRVPEANRMRIAGVTLGLSAVSTAFLLLGAFRVGAGGPWPAFRPSDQVTAFEWLAENAEPGAVVLTAFETGNALPAWAPVFVVIGHGPESANLRSLAPRVNAFFSESGLGQQSAALLREFHVNYVFIGPAERELGFDARIRPEGLAEVYAQGEVAVYRVLSGITREGPVPVPARVVFGVLHAAHNSSDGKPA
jgi:hypothetical protein